MNRFSDVINHLITECWHSEFSYQYMPIFDYKFQDLHLLSFGAYLVFDLELVVFNRTGIVLLLKFH